MLILEIKNSHFDFRIHLDLYLNEYYILFNTSDGMSHQVVLK